MTPTQRQAIEMAITAIENLQRETVETFASTFRTCCSTTPDEPHKYCELDDAVKALSAALTEPKPLFKPLIDQHPGLAEELAEQVDGKAERKSLNAKIADQLRPFLRPGDKVIWRESFRWFDDNGVLPNHYDSMELDQLADLFGYEIDWDTNMHHAAVVRNAAARSKT